MISEIFSFFYVTLIQQDTHCSLKYKKIVSYKPVIAVKQIIQSKL